MLSSRLEQNHSSSIVTTQSLFWGNGTGSASGGGACVALSTSGHLSRVGLVLSLSGPNGRVVRADKRQINGSQA
jgi:hypothetical protein